ncbi:hypothetical protein CBL_21066, partial [Carabus blaptoides fortunei]
MNGQNNMENEDNIELQCPIIGPFGSLNLNKFPTTKKLLSSCEYTRHQMKHRSKLDPSVKKIVRQVIPVLEIIWGNTPIPTISTLGIEKLLLKLYEKLRKLKNRHAAKSDSPQLIADIEKFNESLGGLFDICSCKCKNFAECSCLPPKIKVPDEFRDFLADQRSDRAQSVPPAHVEIIEEPRNMGVIQNDILEDENDILEDSTSGEEGRGTINMLENELRMEDPESYRMFLRMCGDHFDELLAMVINDINRQHTNMRQCVTTAQ